VVETAVGDCTIMVWAEEDITPAPSTTDMVVVTVDTTMIIGKQKVLNTKRVWWHSLFLVGNVIHTGMRFLLSISFLYDLFGFKRKKEQSFS